MLKTKKVAERKIIDLDSKSAVTIFSVITIERDHPNEELGMADLENYISQVVWKNFDRSRNEAALRLGVDEVDLLLTDARIIEIKIDGHRIINPYGFTGRALEVSLVITMVRRDRFTDGADIFEGGSIRAFLLAKNLKAKEAIYVEVGTPSSIFSITPTKISYLSEFNWGEENIRKAIAEALGIDEGTAGLIYPLYVKQEVSPKFFKKLDEIFYQAFNTFVNGLTMGLKNFIRLDLTKLPPIYIKSFFPLPEEIYRKRFALNNKKIRLLRVLPKNGEDNLELKNFLEDDIHKIYGELNQLAKRRIKWLMPIE